MRAHQAAKAAVKKVNPDLKVGIPLSLHDIQPVDGEEERARQEWEEEFLHYLPYIREDDFFGLLDYTRTIMGSEGNRPAPKRAELTQMDYEFNPQALGHVIRAVNRGLSNPILITENGIGTDDDPRRIAFIKEALNGVKE